MKKFLSFLKYASMTLFVASVCIIPAYASGAACDIDNGMSEELTAYIRTMGNLLSRIEEEAAKKQCNTNTGSENSASASVDKTMSTVIGSMNESIGFSNFYTSGRFYIDIALKTEIPRGITRDHERLGKEIERIKNVIETVHGRCAEDIVPKLNLSEDPVYDTSGKSLGAMLTEILKNQVNMMNFYRETVLGDKTDNAYSFILVGNPDIFRLKIQKSYGPNAFESCVRKSDFFKSVKEAFGRIVGLGGSIEKGMTEWEKAWKLLNSNSSDREYAEVERNVLRSEMSHQGMATKGSQTVMNNLAKYNSQNTREGTSGFISSIGERVYASIDQFGKVYDGIRAMLRKPQTTDKYMDTTRTFAILKTDINAEIIKDYENAKSLIGPENQSADEAVAKLIDTHILIESTNKFVKPYIKVSEQTCNGQSTGEGNCYFR